MIEPRSLMASKPHTLTIYTLTAVLLLLIFAVGRSMPIDLQREFFSEGGWVEILSAISYVLCAGYFVARPERAQLWPYTVLMLLFAARELDFDKRFTEVGVLKGSFLFSPAVPHHQKILGGAILLLAIYILFRILRHHTLPFVKALRQRDPAATGWGVAIILLIVSKTIDGLPRKAADFGMTVSYEAELFAWALEEVMELGVGVYIFVATRHRLRQA